PHVADGTARTRRDVRRIGEGGPRCGFPDQRGFGIPYTQRGGRHRRQSDARVFNHAGVGVDTHPSPRSRHGDVHLVSGDKAKIRPTLVLRRGPQPHADEDLTLLQHRRPRTGAKPVDGHLSFAVWPRDHRHAVEANERRHAVGRRGRVAKIAADARPALYLDGADEGRRIDQNGVILPYADVRIDGGARSDGAQKRGAVVVPFDAMERRDPADVDDPSELASTLIELDDQIGTSGERTRGAGACCQSFDCFLDRAGSHVLETVHGAPSYRRNWRRRPFLRMKPSILVATEKPGGSENVRALFIGTGGNSYGKQLMGSTAPATAVTATN